MPHPYFTDGPYPRVLAHRGLVTPELQALGVVENSLAALQAAVDAGSVYIESDCRLTHDGEVVLFHDVELQRVLGDSRKIADVSTPELEAMLADRGGLATLRQALDVFPNARFNIDVKAPAAAEPTGRIVAPHAERVLVTSFSDARRITAMRAAATVNRTLRPATAPGRSVLLRVLGAVASRSHRLANRSLSDLDALQVPEYHGRVRVITQHLIAATHSAGVEVHAWTINDPEDMNRLVRLGVDGIVTDRADTATRILRS